jgi:hypothetical protein
MYVFPVLRWLKVFSQTWEGDVTMVLPSSYMQLKKSITNPSHADLLQACKQVLPLLPASPASAAAALFAPLQQSSHLFVKLNAYACSPYPATCY